MQRYIVGLRHRQLFTPQIGQSRSFWEYVNMMFNKPDPERIKTVGPDRACAEWVLRNGGKVTWADDGCTMLKKIILHENKYIDNRALKGLEYGKEALGFVQVSKCVNVTDSGLKELTALKNLETLILYDLISVKDLQGCKQYLSSELPKCKVLGELDVQT
ncbi:ATP synthase subunit s, mitochondrial isoform X2 [Battus philenor]|uniref:ATP synthase subunit s, mitochondrial isoform X2 n=1 Tax=Battus philenor TaxID=42288 RepID=UPI0035D04663